MDDSMYDLSKLDDIGIYNLVRKELESFYCDYKNIIIGIEEFKDIALEEIHALEKNKTTKDKLVDLLIKKIEQRLKIEREITTNPEYRYLLNDSKKYELLPQDKTLELIKLAQEGDNEALQTLISHNIRLIISIAGRFKGCGIEFEDLVQEGAIGFVEAIRRFDFNKGLQLSTPAVYWIKSKIYKAIHEHARVIRVPVDHIEKYKKLKKAYDILYEKLKREPSLDEIAEFMGITYEECFRIHQMDSHYLLRLNQKDIRGDSEIEFGDFIESDENTEESVMKITLNDDIKKALENSKLTQKEMITVIYRFGLFNNKKLTLDEIGKMINLTRERVRQLEKTGIDKLKKSEAGRSLKSYIGNVKPTSQEKQIEVKERNEYESIRNQLSEEMFSYLHDCGLTSFEMTVLAYSFGLIDGKVYLNKEIAAILEKSQSITSVTLSTAISKLKDDKIKSDLFAYTASLMQNKKNVSTSFTSRNIYEVIGCNEEELDYAISMLSSEELEILKKRSESTYRFSMSKTEIKYFNNKLLGKIKKIIKSYRHKQIKYSHEFLEIEENIKKKKNQEDLGLYSILVKISDTNFFKELVNHFSIKEAVAIILLNGYVNYSYSIDSVSKLLNISTDEIHKALKKSTIVLKYINHKDIETVKKLSRIKK